MPAAVETQAQSTAAFGAAQLQPFQGSLQIQKDAFDAANFNAVAYINEMFPTGPTV